MSTSNSMHANRKALLDRAKKLGIAGRHKMNAGTLRARIQEAERAGLVTEGPTFSPGGFISAVNESSRLQTLSFTEPGQLGIERLRKVRSESNPDDFEHGTVIRWTASGRYTYAAIKVPLGWFTTARHFNEHVDQFLSFEELLEVLGRSETTDVAVATVWENIG